MKIAAARYVIAAPGNFQTFAARVQALLREARGKGAELAVLPEYLALELGATLPRDQQGDLAQTLAALQPLHESWCTLFAGLARELQMTVVAGSFLLRRDSGRYRNRSHWFAADGRAGFQDKLQLTGFEKQTGLIEAGDALTVFETGGIRAGIAVCYDSEFPLPVRRQWEAGARLIAVPSCTDTAAGATRVRVGCLARALENRVFVAQAVTAGEAPWSPALDINTGEAAIYAPMDVGLPDDGVLAQTVAGDSWAMGDLDFAALEDSRAQAQVANDRDWPGQLQPGILAARLDR